MVDFSEFIFGREEARSKGASGGWVFLVCNFLADQEHLGRGKCGGDGIPLRRTGFRCAGGAVGAITDDALV